MKQTLLKTSGLAGRFKRSEDGATALTFALGLTVMMMGVGVGVDYAAASKAQSKAQLIADASALAAAAWIRENPEPPTSSSQGFVDGVDYKASDLGWAFADFVVDGAEGVKIKVEYEDTFAVATVQGKTNPSIMKLWGHNEVQFAARAEAIYAVSNGGKPASVFLVLDNSGSMNWDDGSGERRIDGLVDSVEGFLGTLGTLEESLDEGGQRPLRMGMVPFTGLCEPLGNMCNGVDQQGIVVSQTDVEDFGLLDEEMLGALIPRGATDPVAALELTAAWMEDEEDVHRDELLRTNPDNFDEDTFEVLRYVVLMSDGANSQRLTDCTPNTWSRNDRWRWIKKRKGVNYWEYHASRLVEYNYDGRTPSERDYSGWTQVQWAHADWNSSDGLLGWRTLVDGEIVYRDANYVHEEMWKERPTDESVSKLDTALDREKEYRDRITGIRPYTPRNQFPLDAPDNENSDYNADAFTVNDISNQAASRPYWTDCQTANNDQVDAQMQVQCDALKRDGVEVYTIGYGIEPRSYNTNWATLPVQDINQANSTRARDNLLNCATSPDHYMLADNADALQSVFQEIGQSIVDDSIRLSK